MGKRTEARMVRVYEGYTTHIEAVAQSEPGRVLLYVAAVRVHSTKPGADKAEYQQQYDTYEEAVIALDDGLFNLSTLGYQLQMRVNVG